jgi:hypothetical protein
MMLKLREFKRGLYRHTLPMRPTLGLVKETMMQKLVRFVGGVGIVLAVAGCGTTLQTEVTSSSPRTVSVQSFIGMADAQKFADVECAKYGRFGRWVKGDVTYIFDCVL